MSRGEGGREECEAKRGIVSREGGGGEEGSFSV